MRDKTEPVREQAKNPMERDTVKSSRLLVEALRRKFNAVSQIPRPAKESEREKLLVAKDSIERRRKLASEILTA